MNNICKQSTIFKGQTVAYLSTSLMEALLHGVVQVLNLIYIKYQNINDNRNTCKKPCNLLTIIYHNRLKVNNIESTLDISNCQGTNKFVRDIESSTYRVVILCKLIRMGPIVLFEASRVRLIEYLTVIPITSIITTETVQGVGACDQNSLMMDLNHKHIPEPKLLRLNFFIISS